MQPSNTYWSWLSVPFIWLSFHFVAWSTVKFTGLPLTSLQTFFLTGITLAFVFICIRFTRLTITLLVLLSCSLAAGIWYYDLWSCLASTLLLIAGEYNQVISAMIARGVWELSLLPAIVATAATCLLAAFAILYLTLFRGDYWFLLLAGNVILAWQWMFWFDPAFMLALGFNVTGLTAASLIHLGWRNTNWRTMKLTYRNFYERDQAPLALAAACCITLAAIVLPYGFKPVDWQAAGERLTKLIPVLEDMRGQQHGDAPWAFSLTGAGSGREAHLGGPSKVHSEDVLYVRLDGARVTGPLYLRGSIRDQYTGSSWRQSVVRWTDYRRDTVLTHEFHPAVQVVELHQEVVLLHGRTSQLFAVAEVQSVNVPGSRYQQDTLGALRSRSVLSEGDRYLATSTFPSVTIETVRRLSPADPEYGPEMKQYLQLPTDLPDRVLSQTDHLIHSASSSHPVDIALAIESFIRSYRYYLSPPETPDNRDFVDHFLFDLRYGYCTYHSTAMVVLLRAAGVPARWVEGFIIHRPTYYSPNVIRGYHAHSWAEAYFPGFGWIPFEATPAYRTGHGQTDRGDSAQLISPPRDMFSEGMFDEGWLEDMSPDWFDHSDIQLPTEQLEPEPDLMPLIIAGCLLLTAGAGTGYSAYRIRSRERIPHDPQKAVKRCMMLSIDLLRRFGHPRPLHRTPLEFCSDLTDKLPPDVIASLSSLTINYYSSVFSQRSPDATAAEQAITAWQQLSSTLKEKWGWLQFILRRLI